jgi:hypothetical protein
MNSSFCWRGALLAALLCAGCGRQPQAAPTTGAETPAAVVATTAPSPAPALGAAPLPVETATQPAPLAATAAPAGTQPSASSPEAPTSLPVSPLAEAPFTYLWPAYLPEDLRPAPAESRIARDGELGAEEIGFYIVTFSGEGRKLILGGGAAEAIPLTGRISTVLIGEQGARLITSGEQRQLLITGYQGSLFVHGIGISEEELTRVAESLRPLDVREMRERAGVES